VQTATKTALSSATPQDALQKGSKSESEVILLLAQTRVLSLAKSLVSKTQVGARKAATRTAFAFFRTGRWHRQAASIFT
jgi:hypothetical protein